MEVEVVDSRRAVFIVGALILPSDPWHQLKGSDRLLPQPRRTTRRSSIGIIVAPMGFHHSRHYKFMLQ